MTGTIALGAAAFAVHAALSPDDDDHPRRSFLIAGSAAGIAAAGWLISASIARTAADGGASAIGALGLAAIASLAYGLLPFAVAPRTT
ncbi:MAG TPA: hypothetical protein VNJ54_08620 [Plantibacter sp.]|uniref:hypothetical protein n=1 Tax=unclassified Plantibacter TaxID=2624265 RepID=UPI002BEE5D2A|nr:hypothetical protein [Plantibacter sp.]